MSTKDIIQSINGIYMNYKDIMIAFRLCKTKACKVKSEVALNPKNLCPFNTQLVRTKAVFEYMNTDYNEYLKTLKEIKENEC